MFRPAAVSSACGAVVNFGMVEYVEPVVSEESQISVPLYLRNWQKLAREDDLPRDFGGQPRHRLPKLCDALNNAIPVPDLEAASCPCISPK